MAPLAGHAVQIDGCKLVDQSMPYTNHWGETINIYEFYSCKPNATISIDDSNYEVIYSGLLSKITINTHFNKLGYYPKIILHRDATNYPNRVLTCPNGQWMPEPLSGGLAARCQITAVVLAEEERKETKELPAELLPAS